MDSLLSGTGKTSQEQRVDGTARFLERVWSACLHVYADEQQAAQATEAVLLRTIRAKDFLEASNDYRRLAILFSHILHDARDQSKPSSLARGGVSLLLLTPNQALSLMLSYNAQLAPDQIAQAMNLSIEDTKALLGDARRHLLAGHHHQAL